MRNFIRVLLVILVIALLFISVPPLILAYPDFLFEEKFTYKNFVILSDKEVDEKTKEMLDSISTTLSRTGFYKETEPIKIILCSNERLTTFFDKISLAPGGAGFHHFSGNIYLFNERIDQFRKENLKATGEEKRLLEYTYQEFKVDKILTHEILHKLHSDTLGVWEFKRKMPPPHWKAEGFAEYYTFYLEKRVDKNYDLRDRIKLYLTYKDQFPLFYYRSQLIYEFLTEYKHLKFTEIMHDNVTETETYNELIRWYNDKN